MSQAIVLITLTDDDGNTLRAVSSDNYADTMRALDKRLSADWRINLVTFSVLPAAEIAELWEHENV